MKKLRIGIVGAGTIVRQRHVPGICAEEDVEIVAVANSTPASAKSFCEECAPQAEVVADWRELVCRPDVDIVWIGTGPSLHAPVTIASLEAGKHVFCQARMSTDLESALRMLAASEARPDQVTMLCPPPQRLRTDAFVRKLLAEKVVGEIRSLRLRSLNSLFLDPAKPAHWRQQTGISGKNIMSLGIHTEVLQRWFGPFGPKAAIGRVFVEKRGKDTVKIPDEVTILADLASGGLVVLELSGVWSGPAVEMLEVCGSTGLITIDFAQDKIILSQPGKAEPRTLDVPSDLDRPWRVEADFIDAVRNSSAPRPHPTFRDGVAYMEVVEAVWNLL